MNEHGGSFWCNQPSREITIHGISLPPRMAVTVTPCHTARTRQKARTLVARLSRVVSELTQLSLFIFFSTR